MVIIESYYISLVKITLALKTGAIVKYLTVLYIETSVQLRYVNKIISRLTSFLLPTLVSSAEDDSSDELEPGNPYRSG